MPFEQRKLVAKINSTFGSLLFISDDRHRRPSFIVSTYYFAVANVEFQFDRLFLFFLYPLFPFEQRKLVAKINSTFGSLLFISDDVSRYNEEQKAALKETFAQKDIKIISAEFVQKDIMKAVFEEDGKPVELKFNVAFLLSAYIYI